jgi:Tfp pilus assembly protein PilO
MKFERAVDLPQVALKHAGSVVKEHKQLVVCILMVCFISLLGYFAVSMTLFHILTLK